MLLAVAGVHGLAQPLVLGLQQPHLGQKLGKLVLQGDHLLGQLSVVQLVGVGLLFGGGFQGVQLSLYQVQASLEPHFLVVYLGLLQLQAVGLPLQGEYLVLELEYLVLVLPAYLGGGFVVVAPQAPVLLGQLLDLVVQVIDGLLGDCKLLLVESSR